MPDAIRKIVEGRWRMVMEGCLRLGHRVSTFDVAVGEPDETARVATASISISGQAYIWKSF